MFGITNTPVKNAEDENRAYVLRNLNELRIKKQYCDITVILDNDTRYPCHRNVLASISEYFHSLFTSNLWDESNLETTLKDVSGPIFDAILNYAYVGVLNITAENAYELLKAADYLQTQRVLDECVEFIKKTPHVLHVLEICSYAFYPMENLDFVKSIARNIAPKIQAIANTSEFLNISFNVLYMIIEEIVAVLTVNADCSSCGHSWELNHYRRHPPDNGYYCSGKNCGVRVCPPRADVLPHIVKWLNHDLIERKKYFRRLATRAKVPKEYIDDWESTLNRLEDQYIMMKLEKGDST